MCSRKHRQTEYIYLLIFFIMKKIINDYLSYEKNILNRWEWVIRTKKAVLEQFYTYLCGQYWDVIQVEKISVQDCILFLEYYKSSIITRNWWSKWKHPQHNTCVEKMKNLKIFFEYLKMLKYNTLNPKLLPKMKKEHKEWKICSDYEYFTLRNAMTTNERDRFVWLRNQLLLDIPYHTWLRRSEIVRCKFSDFKSENNQFQIKRKWWHIDSVFFSDKIKNLVLEYEKEVKIFLKGEWIVLDHDYIFFSLWSKKGKRILSSAIASIYRKYSLKLIKEWKLTRIIMPHMLRHSFATNCVYAWLSQQATTALMGHRDPRTTLTYYHLNDTRLQNQYKKISVLN